MREMSEYLEKLKPQKAGNINTSAKIQECFDEIVIELVQAMTTWPPFNSMHEGYGVLLEEVDELWDHVKTKQKNRQLAVARKEALQVAAMAIRFALEVCDEERGRK